MKIRKQENDLKKGRVPTEKRPMFQGQKWMGGPTRPISYEKTSKGYKEERDGDVYSREKRGRAFLQWKRKGMKEGLVRGKKSPFVAVIS